MLRINLASFIEILKVLRSFIVRPIWASVSFLLVVSGVGIITSPNINLLQFIYCFYENYALDNRYNICGKFLASSPEQAPLNIVVAFALIILGLIVLWFALFRNIVSDKPYFIGIPEDGAYLNDILQKIAQKISKPVQIKEFAEQRYDELIIPAGSPPLPHTATAEELIRLLILRLECDLKNQFVVASDADKISVIYKKNQKRD